MLPSLFRQPGWCWHGYSDCRIGPTIGLPRWRPRLAARLFAGMVGWAQARISPGRTGVVTIRHAVVGPPRRGGGQRLSRTRGERHGPRGSPPQPARRRAASPAKCAACSLRPNSAAACVGG